MAKPDNREDNVEHLQEHVQNTIDNLEESQEYIEEFGDELNEKELSNIVNKNERRRESIAGFREEIKDEAADQKSH
jgi:small acid-soluble spore protein (thioredoxin-like protein)